MEEKLKILAIDDDEAILALYENYIERLGFVPVLANGGNEALERVKDEADSLAIIICDYNMPDLNGLQVREKILEFGQQIPFVIVSAFITKGMLEQGIKYQIAALIDKPMSPEDLQNTIKVHAKNRIEQIEEKKVLVGIFCAEALELLEELEPLILTLETNPGDPGTVNSIFRLVHTIKGGSGVIDWSQFTKFMHHYEDILSKIKSRKLAASEEIVSTLLKGFDHLAELVRSLSKKQRVEVDLDRWLAIFDRALANGQPPVETAEAPPPEPEPAQAKEQDTSDNIKVPTQILNEFMELSGEITVLRNTVNKAVKNIEREIPGNKDITLLAELLDEMHKINGAMQHKITELRKVPLNQIYRIIPRTIRDLSRDLNKKLQFNTVGGDLRVDNVLANVLSNSLIHIVRNCADHGIEAADIREQRQKPDVGTIAINAQQVGEDVIVEVSDDGGGIDPDKIGQLAVEKGLYTQEQVASMTPRRLFSIIFESGFSTASKVTAVSGRGVGMDMVRSSVENVRGRIDIDSTIGKGSVFRFILPIPKSVLIIKSLLVRCGHSFFNIPQDNIVRLLRFHRDRAHECIRSVQGTTVLQLGNTLYPMVYLKDILGIPCDGSSEEINILLVSGENSHYALVVDYIIDAEEIVVKALDKHLQHLGVFSGATFMGDGKVGLILDIDGIATMGGLQDSHPKTAEESENEIDEQALNRKEFLVADAGGKTPYCIDLENVFRLEEFNTAEIRYAGDETTVIYRDRIMPLKALATILDINPNALAEISSQPKMHTIVLKNKDLYLGLVVKQILEIAVAEEDVDTSVSNHPQLEGTIVIGDNLLNVVDLSCFIGDRTTDTLEETTSNPNADSGQRQESPDSEPDGKKGAPDLVLVPKETEAQKTDSGAETSPQSPTPPTDREAVGYELWD